jgi:uncharacterized protein YkwD
MRRFAPSLSALLLFAAAAAEPPKKPGKEAPLSEIDRKVLDRLNAARKAAGVDPVVMDAKLSEGCAAHAKYVMKHFDHLNRNGISVHGEDAKMEGYSKAGADAGKNSNINYVEPMAALEGLIATVYHRIPMFNADLKKVGLGYTTGTGNPPYVVVLDVLSGLPALGDDRKKVVIWPPDGMTDIGLTFDGERPTPIPEAKDGKGGYPVTVTFREIVKVTGATASMREKGAKEDLAVWVATPEKSPQPEGQRNSISLVAKDPLRPGITYVVTASATLDGDSKKKWTKTWSFTTKK